MNKYKQLNYDIIGAYLNGINEHPQKQMEILGYKVLYAVAQSVYDSWWFTVEDFIEPLPSYLSKMEYDFNYWHGDGTKIVC